MSEFRPPRDPFVAPGEADLQVRDMTATFAADVGLGAAQAKLADVGQWLPIDGDHDSSLGDLIAFNSTGPLRLGYGAWRDLLLGVQFANGRGELISAGGRTMKNVAGYDLTKFMVGSAGVFGKIVTLTVRTYQKPWGALLARHRPDVGILGRLMPTPLRPQWAMLAGDALFCGYLGDERTIDYFRETVGQSEPLSLEQRTVEDDVAGRARLWRTRGRLTSRASVPPMRIAEFIAKAGGDWIADAAFGIVLGSNLIPSQIPPLRDAAAALDGSIRFVTQSDGPDAAQLPSLVDVSTNPIERQIIERLKHAFDPDGNLNPLPWQTR